MIEPLDDSVLEALRRYDTPTVCNAIETFDVRPRDEGFAPIDVRCMFPDLGVMVGYALTATISGHARGSYDVEPLITHVRSGPKPGVVVVQDLDDPPGVGSLWGEITANAFTALGCVGAVTDGCVRDLSEVHDIGFQFYARGAGVSHAYVRVESAGEPVEIAGLRVEPGDLIHADQHGVLVVPSEIAPEIAAAADRVTEGERALIDWIRSSEFRGEDLPAVWNKAMEQ